MQRVRTQVGVDWKEWEDWMGNSVTIAVLDTGIGRHPDLQDRAVCFRDFIHHRNLMYDDNGHGTHICGILCGSGVVSNGRYAGMAPNSHLVIGKVLDEKGDGLTLHMLEGMEWVLENKEKYHIRILNISVGIGSLNEPAKERALREMVETLWRNGIVVVCAAGNKGPANDSISSVGGSGQVITVGCHDGTYSRDNPRSCEQYSGRGALLSPVRKPDIVAPGTDIVSCNVHVQKQYGRILNPYIAKSGTSMATPIISGGIALLLQKYPDLDNETVKHRLTYAATDLGEPWNKQGWGMMNVRKMLERY